MPGDAHPASSLEDKGASPHCANSVLEPHGCRPYHLCLFAVPLWTWVGALPCPAQPSVLGCACFCWAQYENIELIPPNILKFDFLGKDSIRYENSHEVRLLDKALRLRNTL